MREIRSSGSVEGVMSNHDPYSDSFGDLRVACYSRFRVRVSGANIAGLNARLTYRTQLPRIGLQRNRFQNLLNSVDARVLAQTEFNILNRERWTLGAVFSRLGSRCECRGS